MNNAYLKYVMVKDALNSEHYQLGKHLRRILINPDNNDYHFQQNLHSLTEFLDLLQRHQATEDTLLLAIGSQSSEVHLQVHQEILDYVLFIVQKSRDERSISPELIQRLLTILEAHITTLDLEFEESFDHH